MNKKQRWVLIIGGIIIAQMLLNPPFEYKTLNGVTYSGGYGCLFTDYGSGKGVNLSLLFTQWIGVILICAILWIVFKN